MLTLGKKRKCIGPGQKLLIVMQQANILFLLQNFQMGINKHIKDFIIPLSIFSYITKSGGAWETIHLFPLALEVYTAG